MKDEKISSKSRAGKKAKLVEAPKKEAECKDRDCPIHGSLKVRGRFFEGVVTKKFSRRLVIEFERMIYIRKYERYSKSKTRIHARLPYCMEDKIKLGDYIKVQECRPLSKIIHFVVIEKIRDVEVEKSKNIQNKTMENKKQ